MPDVICEALGAVGVTLLWLAGHEESEVGVDDIQGVGVGLSLKDPGVRGTDWYATVGAIRVKQSWVAV